jgi:hypothetical protein
MTEDAQDAQQPPDAAQTQGTYVYGIVRAGAALGALEHGDDGLPQVRLVEAGDIAALVSDSPERATRDSVLGHGRVLEAALEGSPVVPLRYGLVVTDEDAVRSEILEAHHDELAQLLERFDGRVQMTLKVYYREDAVVASILAEEPELARLRDAVQGKPEDASYKERVRLGELLNKAIEKRRTNDGKEILERLRPLAEAVGLEPAEDELMVAHVVFLLRRDQVGELDLTLEEVAQERAELMRFRLIGPMPAYHFIEFQEPAWA